MVVFSGWIVRERPEGPEASLEELDSGLLPDFDTKVVVRYSSLNYKDAIALQGRRGVIRRYPLIPGIDLVGEVTASSNPRWSPGDMVVLNGAGIGEEHHGGLAELANVRGDDCVALPEVFSASQAAAIGTAGFTAALSLRALERSGLTPDSGPVLVTGAGGGVGSVAIALLANSGFETVAVTGRPDELRDQLKGLGATRIIARHEVADPDRPLGKQRWAGVIDSVGGPILAGALSTLQHSGVATTCGLAAGAEFPGNVLPFIIRGVSLLGIDSVRISRGLRQDAWERMARDLPPTLLDGVTRTVGLGDAKRVAAELMAGRGTGRTVVEIGG